MESNGLMSSCTMEPCPGTGVWRPMLILKQKTTGMEIEATLDVDLCEAHKDLSKLDDVLSPEGWDRIQKFLRESGKGEFVKKSTILRWTNTPGAPEPIPF